MKNLLLLILLSNILIANILNLKIAAKGSYKAESFREKIKLKKGEYMLLSPRNRAFFNWAKRFKIVELGGIDNPRIASATFKNLGLDDIPYRLGYSWMPAFYYYVSGNNREYVKWLYENRDQYTLNPNGPFLHCKKNGYDWCKDFFYNYGDNLVLESRVVDLKKSMKKRNFNGIFFDWGAGKFYDTKEFAFIKKRFKELNPKKDYHIQVSKLYKRLKKDGIFFVTNQAFRNAKYLLPYIKYDMTESYITKYKTQSIRIQLVGVGWKNKIDVSVYYPIYKNSRSIKDSLHFIDLLTKYKNEYKKFGFKNFIYLNYLAPKYEKVYSFGTLYKEVEPKNGIYFSYAMAKLTDNMVYAQIPANRKLEMDDIYFYDLGKVSGKNYSKLRPINGYIRFYKNGFVLVGEAYKGTRYISLKSSYLPKKGYLFDPYNNVKLPIKDHKVVLKLAYEKDTFTHKYLPLGRVYLFRW